MALLIYLLQVSAVMAVLTLLYRLLLRREGLLNLNRMMLWCNVILAFGMPLVEFPDFRPTPVKTLVKPVEAWVEPKIEELRQTPTPILPPKARIKNGKLKPKSIEQFDWLAFIKWGYWGVLGIMFLRFLWQMASLIKLILSSKRIKIGRFWHVQNARINAPFSFLIWIFYNPDGHNDDELTQILAHEQVHVSQWHSGDMLLAEALRIVLWFNPFAWWHGRLVQENLEYLADKNTLSTGIDRRSYQLHLLKTTIKPQTINSKTMKKKILLMVFMAVQILSGSVLAQKEAFRYAYEKDNYLYCLITAKMSIKDMAKLQELIRSKTNEELRISNLAFDPLRKYITSLEGSFKKSKEGFILGTSYLQPIKSLVFRIYANNTGIAPPTFGNMELTKGINFNKNAAASVSKYVWKGENNFSQIREEDNQQIKFFVERIKKLDEFARTLVSEDPKETGYFTQKYNQDEIEKEIKREADEFGDIYLKKGDLMPKYHDVMGCENAMVYASNGVVLTDGELSRIRTKDIAMVNVYDRSDMIKIGGDYKFISLKVVVNIIQYED